MLRYNQETSSLRSTNHEDRQVEATSRPLSKGNHKETSNACEASAEEVQDIDVSELDGLAIMSDTDNSKMKAIAYFQNIYFSSE